MGAVLLCRCGGKASPNLGVESEPSDAASEKDVAQPPLPPKPTTPPCTTVERTGLFPTMEPVTGGVTLVVKSVAVEPGGAPCGRYWLQSTSTRGGGYAYVELTHGTHVVSKIEFHSGEIVSSDAEYPFTFPGFFTVRVGVTGGSRSLTGIETDLFDGEKGLTLVRP